ncbi:Gag-Pol polyprotein [Plecturocebus cupreus]
MDWCRSYVLYIRSQSLSTRYTLMGLIPASAAWFTFLDLKDAFFCFPLAPVSQPIFAFHGGGASVYLDKTPTRYTDDLLSAAPTWQDCLQGTEDLLCLLWKAGHKVSRKKTQTSSPAVKYLGFIVRQGKHELGSEQKKAVCALPTSTTWHQIREFLGAAGFSCIWIPNFSLMAKPPYEATKRGEKEPLLWGTDQEMAFKKIKKVLIQAPALGLSDQTKPFFLYVHEQKEWQ